jgi:hypothetical protein
MFYRIFFDPEVVRPAYEAGAKGMSLLLSIWRGFLLNCSICEVDGYLIQKRLGEIIREITKDSEIQNNGLFPYVNSLKKILEGMKKQNRFVDVLSTTEGDQSLALLALIHSKSVGVDLILTNQTLPDESGSPEMAELDDYFITNFERERAKQNDDGLIAEGEDSADDFFPKRFGKLLPLAKNVVIVDAILGRKFGDNFQYTLKLLIKYLNSTNSNPSDLYLDIHTEDSDRIDFLELRLTEWCSPIRYRLHRHESVPHERYLFTDQFGLQLGIGCDLLCKKTRRNRATDFSYARVSKLNELIRTR